MSVLQFHDTCPRRNRFRPRLGLRRNHHRLMDQPDFRKPARTKPASVDLSKLDRLPPFSSEAEQGVLGCILLSPNECLSLCVEKLKAGPECFYDLRHQTLYEVLVSMFEEKKPIDLITVQQHLKDAGVLEGVGELSYLSGLMDAVPSAANLAYYLDIIGEKFVLRRMLRACTQVIARVHEHEGEVDELIDEVERDILKIGEDRDTGVDYVPKEAARQVIEQIQQYHQRQGEIRGLPTSLPDLDKVTNGLHDGEMIVVAARPSTGKTAQAMQIADHVADAVGNVLVFSLEMTAKALNLRRSSHLSRVPLKAIKDGVLTEGDMRKLTAAAAKIGKGNLHIDDRSGLTIGQIRGKARRFQQQHGLKLVIIDYLGLVQPNTSRKNDSRHNDVAQVSHGIKALSKELNVPVMVLCQLNRESEKGNVPRKPRLSDLRESGDIEQDADTVFLLHRTVMEDEDESYDPTRVPVTINVAKQRNGEAGVDVHTIFNKPILRFESVSRIQE